MNSLPNEVLIKVFSYLNFEKLIEFKKVCSNWSNVINDLIKNQTIVINRKDEPFLFQQFNSNEYISYSNSLVVYSLNYFTKKNLFLVWKNIKKLIVFDNEIDFNLFENLEHLETHCSRYFELKRFSYHIEIKLKKLKNLDLNFDGYFQTTYTLKTPNLVSLKTSNIENFTFIYPNTLQYLECYVYFSCIKKLVNLEKLICNRFDIYEGKLLENLKKLKELQINYLDKIDLNDLLREKNELKLDKLNIIIKGVIIKTNDYSTSLLNNDFEIFSNSNLELYLNNFDNLSENLHFISDIFIDFDLKILPDDFFNKLNTFRNILVHHDIDDEFKWIKLLSSSKLIQTLKIFCPISQKYCELISKYCSTLRFLSILKTETLNFNFIENFLNLERFNTDKELSVNDFKVLIKNRKFLKFVTFKYRKIDFKIEIIETDIYCEFYKSILIDKIDDFEKKIDKVSNWPELIKQMNSIHLYEKHDFKGKLFRLLYKFKNLGSSNDTNNFLI